MQLLRIAGLGAFAAAFGIVALFALFVWQTVPKPNSGMNISSAWVAWLSVGGVVLVLVAIHVVFGRVLLEWSRHGTDARLRL